jgi:NADP-reducing hydrogenase subunit HndD
VVEVQGGRALAPSCAMPAGDNMVVRTDSPMVLMARRQVLGLLLQSGNHNCASRHRDAADWAGFQQDVQAYDGSDELCEVYGDCRLQSYAYRYQVDSRGLVARSAALPARGRRPADRARFLALHPLRPLHPGLQRHPGQQRDLARLPRRPRQDHRHGRRHAGRVRSAWPADSVSRSARSAPWSRRRPATACGPGRREHVRTTCSYCGVGCQLTLHLKDGTIHKVSGVETAAPNLGRLCVRGRYGYDFVHSPHRLTAPRLRDGEALREATWDEALDRAGAISPRPCPARSAAVAMVCSARAEQRVAVRLAEAAARGGRFAEHPGAVRRRWHCRRRWQALESRRRC